ncbi:HAD family hydrolase [Amycolatopsis sp. H20-H5]|uniref:HAD family hydrolase n=1 Tax=Amycolatopsis sp. H20-H5 TaxID=3046309 RepID=UPI002DBCC0A6|nr:HAD family phosphatase [Amycolatopsis sp. H20-H5]MEC3977070.1 HAD family phosphatase [Amycolatopsis sp. H20-H5]
MNWIVFDYGEVLCERTAALPKLAAALGVEPGAFEPEYWKHRDRYDRGAADLDYWQAIGHGLGVTVDDALAQELTALDIEGWSHTEPASMELLSALHEAGAALALLSNAPSSFGRWVERQEWAKLFRTTVFSADLGCAKPDAEIFTSLLAKLGAAPPDCLFFDDRQSNVDGARAVGLRAERWLGVEAARAGLDEQR